MPQSSRYEKLHAGARVPRVMCWGGLSVCCVLAALALDLQVVAAETAVPVRVVRAAASDSARTLRLTGTVSAKRRARLSARVSGLVAEVHVDAGDRVDKGDVLVDLDRILAELTLRQARAALDEARARLAESRRLQAEAAALLADAFIPESEVEARRATVKRDAATVARLDAESREAHELVGRHSVVAPFAGVIASKRTESGEWVQTGTPVLELVGTEDLRFDVQVPQERFSGVTEGMPVTVRLDSLPDRTLVGHVDAKVPIHDAGARTFLVRVGLDEAEQSMFPGMSGEAVFAIVGEPGTMVVPRDALVRAPDGTDRIWVVEQRGGAAQAFAKPVRIGRSLAETVEVIEGLSAGASVVVRGNESLREEQPVRVLDED